MTRTFAQQLRDEQRKFGLLIRDLRCALGLSQGELAARCELTSQRLSKLERGFVRPRPLEIEALRRELQRAADAALATPPLVLGVAAGPFASSRAEPAP